MASTWNWNVNNMCHTNWKFYHLQFESWAFRYNMMIFLIQWISIWPRVDRFGHIKHQFHLNFSKKSNGKHHFVINEISKKKKNFNCMHNIANEFTWPQKIFFWDCGKKFTFDFSWFEVDTFNIKINKKSTFWHNSAFKG